MIANIQLDDSIVDKIEKLVENKLEESVNTIIEENLDSIILNVVKTQLKSAALLYIQSPELRRKMHEKVKPLIDTLIGEN